MRNVVAVITAIVAVTGIAPADDKKDKSKDVPDALKGEWKVTAGMSGEGVFTSGSGKNNLKIGDGTAEWNSLPSFQKEGKGTLTAQGKDEGTLELKIGDKVYKGLYKRFERERFDKTKDTVLKIVFGKDGKDAPSAFPKDLKLPTDASYFVELSLNK